MLSVSSHIGGSAVPIKFFWWILHVEFKQAADDDETLRAVK